MSRPLPRPRLGQPAPPVNLLDEHANPWEPTPGRITVLIFNRHIH